MNTLEERLRRMTGDLARVVDASRLGVLPDELLTTLTASIEGLGRLVDALRVSVAAELGERSRPELGADGLAARLGCRNANELLQRITRVSGMTADRRLRLGSATTSGRSLAGVPVPARFGLVATALAEGELGVDAASAIVRGLEPAFDRAPMGGVEAAERELVAAATGLAVGAVGSEPNEAEELPGPAPVACGADEIRLQASVWRSLLDPDGAEPAEARSMAARGLRLGPERGGLVKVSGQLLPEAAARLRRLLDAHLSPRTGPVFTPTRKRNSTPDPTSLDRALFSGSGSVGVGAVTVGSVGVGSVGVRAVGVGAVGVEAVGVEAVGVEAVGVEAVGVESVGVEAVGVESAGSLSGSESGPRSKSGSTPLGSEIGSMPLGSEIGSMPLGSETGSPRDANEADIVAPDPRTMDQRRHDVLIGILDAAARSDQTPMLGGAAPTILVTVRDEDLETGRGVAFIDGEQTPVSIRTVRQMVCTGGTQAVTLNRSGGVLSLGSTQRCFTPSQRRAITARDGGCVIPGCQVPASWCEIHHVIPASEGGPTHTDNGVLLCWFHHRSIDTSGWAIRMQQGAPQIQPPPWIDPNQHWHPATISRTRLADALRKSSDHAPT